MPLIGFKKQQKMIIGNINAQYYLAKREIDVDFHINISIPLYSKIF
jgi:hypothetical protein